MRSRATVVLCCLGLLWVTVQVGGCCPLRPPATPFSHTAYGRKVSAHGLNAGCLHSVLAAAPPRQLRALRELMFVANLQMASGNESNPVRLYERVRRELSDPVAISRRTAHRIIAGMAKFVAGLPRTETGIMLPIKQRQGWALVTVMLSPAQGALPTVGDCLDRIMTYSKELAVAFLFREYMADHHYHRYSMRGKILKAVASGGGGARALPLYAYAIKHVYPSKYSSVFGPAVAGARRVLGRAFSAWYWEVRGKSYCSDMR